MAPSVSSLSFLIVNIANVNRHHYGLLPVDAGSVQHVHGYCCQ